MQSPQRKLYRKNHDRIYYNHVVRRVNCTLTKPEHAELCRIAVRAGYKLTVYLKKAALAYERQQFVVPLDVEAKLQKIILVMRNIGANLNQIAARVNRRRVAAEVDIGKTRALVDHLEDMIKTFIRNPKRLHDHRIDES